MTSKGKFIAVANMKGGVGKTTTVVSLAEALAAEDASKKVLVVDLDPQASASVAIAGDAKLAGLVNGNRSIESFLEDRLIKDQKVPLTPLICQSQSDVTHAGKQLDVSLLPCGPHLRIVEREIIYRLSERHYSMNAIDVKIMDVFQREIFDLKKDYDYVIFDCAPGISPVNEAAIRLADLVIVPTIPDYLSIYGLTAFQATLWGTKSTTLPSPKKPPTILITRLQAINQHTAVLNVLMNGAAKKTHAYRMFQTRIPQSAGLVTALTMSGTPTFIQKYGTTFINQVLTPLVAEVKGFL